MNTEDLSILGIQCPRPGLNVYLAMMRIIFQILKLIVRALLGLYFPGATVIGREHLRINGPTILVSNHPNTLADPLNAASRVDQQVHFLANAGLFASSLGNWFFSTFYCIPIRRRKDKANPNVDNRKSFAAINDFLGSGGVLYVAVEGVSDMERRLRPVKTGAARMGFAADAEHDWQLGVKILPVGLTYDRPNCFRSRLVVEAGPPLQVLDWKTAYLNDAEAAIQELTDAIAERLASLVVITDDAMVDTLLFQVQTVLQHDAPLQGEARFRRDQQLAAALNALRRDRLQTFDRLNELAATYFTTLKQRNTTDRWVSRLAQGKRNPTVRWNIILSAPLALYGAFNNLLPAFVSLGIVRKLNLYVGYNSSAKMVAGMVFFPIFYVLQTWVLSLMDVPVWGLIIYAISLLPMGLFAWKWNRRRRGRFGPTNPELVGQRTSFLNALQQLRLLEAFGTNQSARAVK